MNFVQIRTQLSRLTRRIWAWWLDPRDEYADDSYYEADEVIPFPQPPPLPMSAPVAADSENSPAHEMIVMLMACRQDLDEALDEPLSVDGFPMDEVRRIIVECCPHAVSARFSFLARWDEVEDPIERWVNLNQIATMLMTIETYFWPGNPRVPILRQACEARARMAEKLLRWEEAA